MQNIEEALGALSFPEPEPEPEPIKAEEPVVAEGLAEPVTGEEMSAEQKQADGNAKREASAKRVVEEENEHAKDGVSLDELFKMKPEIFQTTGVAEDESGDKKKDKKGKKKAVELQFDEDLGTVVGRKIHKRGEDGGGEDW